MPLSPEQEWTIVACGLVAHADGILEVGEWDQVLYLLDERLDNEESQAWLELLAERRARRRAEGALRCLSAEALKDLGIDRSEVASVARATDGLVRRRYRSRQGQEASGRVCGSVTRHWTAARVVERLNRRRVLRCSAFS